MQEGRNMTQSTVVNICTTCFNRKTEHLAHTYARAHTHSHTHAHTYTHCTIYELRIIHTIDTRFLLSLNHPERPCGPPTLLSKGYRVFFPRVKLPGHDVDH